MSPDQVRFHIGAQGFSARDWVGTFYPPRTQSGSYLDFYARVFDTVEMNTTFYAIPSPAQVQEWAERTPPGFVFTAKLPKAITHEKRLVDAETELGYFCRSVRGFGAKLGAAVIQLPPSFSRESQPDLERFLALLPEDIRFAIEFRHRSWQAEEVVALLRGRGLAWCMNDFRDLPPLTVATADFAYLRLNGYHDEFERITHVQRDRSGELDRWAQVLQDMSSNISHAYIYVNNHYAGHAPATINDLRERLGLPRREPRDYWTQQPSLL